MAKTSVTRCDKFIGLNEALDGKRELALGEASLAENFALTDGQNIRLRPGIRVEDASPGIPACLWCGYIRDKFYMIEASQHPQEAYTLINIRAWNGNNFAVVSDYHVAHAYGKTIVKVFSMFSKVFVAAGSNIYSVEISWDGIPYIVPEAPYVPIVMTGATHEGAGDILENLNILSDFARVEYTSDGEATQYTLPVNANKVTQIMIDNEVKKLDELGTYDKATRTFTFTEAPAKGVNNVEITYQINASELIDAREKFGRMPFSVNYNGSTDSRLFFYGDGSNVTYYTGVTEAARGSALYIPSMNEIAVDMSDSPITGAARHHSKLLFFKPDCTASVTYEPISIADGRTIAGFTMRTIQPSIGNSCYGQVETISNNPRTISNGNLYEWVLPNIYNTDERNAKVISERVSRTLAKADASKIVTLNDVEDTTYYIFCNDDEGTVLVNRYNLGLWVIYKSEYFRNVRYADMYGAWATFLIEKDGESKLCYLDNSYRYDGGIPIKAKWHTGYMDFKLDYMKKYSRSIWVSILPEPASMCTVTASTDRKETYTEKTVGASIYNYGNILYNHWTYSGKSAPTIRRVKLKVKKFVYYKLIFEITEPGCTATILGYDQDIRVGSEVK